ncbi:CRISPR system Cascade subunit CasA [Actinopolymorpha cephalotaxi]|uniref:CRISPR system Cascade subunit CasA n=1 Tax=Actinopolymorpha cephalotaxi TaxID=504797 RepID=A0A1I3CEM4_9ACTN|nr:type I-E CRISPR-associated protein Cse1/CasA [Actinopolymorpha cephalotaxi]NYH82079.1 CRISPR system Cascade subunit CasA [Actinopolymorpha cephalotaxi]SFH72998.1 CRISPR system Cascade subunit CasA [Actinopolymorpha cephalotaxi]
MRGQASFDLIEAPWIRALRHDGRPTEVSILELFGSAAELRSIVGEVPTQTFATVRLLLAILHRAIDGPQTTEDWHELWRSGELPMEDITDYLDGFRDRFDLLHPRTPFYQVADLHTSKNEFFGLERLIADVPNGEPFFTSRVKDGLTRVSFAEAARWVVHCQAFDPSGIKSGAVGDPRVKGGRGYPIGTGWCGRLGGLFAEGRNVRETLLLNLSGGLSEDDLPAWERPPSDAREADVAGRPDGQVDLYTWQSRRIRLFADADGVYGVLIANGDKLDPHNLHGVEPLTAWRRSPAQEKARKEPLVYLPRTHDPDRSLWQGLGALLPSATGSRSSRDGATAVAPAVLEWIAQLEVEGLLAGDYVVRTRAIGMEYGSQAATTAEVFDDSLTLAAALLKEQDTELGACAVGAVADAERGVQALGNLASNLAQAAGDRQPGARGKAHELGYSMLDGPFRSWLAGLRTDTDILQARREWQLAARRILGDLGRQMVADAGPTAWVGREVDDTRPGKDTRHVSSPEADLSFRRQIAKAFELAGKPDRDEVPA